MAAVSKHLRRPGLTRGPKPPVLACQTINVPAFGLFVSVFIKSFDPTLQLNISHCADEQVGQLKPGPSTFALLPTPL
jgi:hypothetical protein